MKRKTQAGPSVAAAARASLRRVGRFAVPVAGAFAWVALLIGVRTALSQQGGNPAERFAKMSADAEAKGLAEPFKGITTDGAPKPGLFEVRSTGVSTEPVRKAAEAFLAALSPAQR